MRRASGLSGSASLRFLVTACIVAGFAPPLDAQARDYRASIALDTTVRTYLVHAPSGTDPVPLLLVFHGAGGRAADLQASLGLDAEADRRRFVVAYLDAPLGNWAEHCDCNNADRLGVNDTGFVRRAIDSIAAARPLDRRRIFAAGYSQGGLFSQRLACEMAGEIAAVATVAATISAPLDARCQPARPVAMLIMHGTRDPIFGWQGSGAGALAVLGAEAAVARWAARNRCGPRPAESLLPDHLRDGARIRKLEYRDCARGGLTVLYAVEGGGHEWPGVTTPRDVHATRIITTFFLALP